MLRVVEHFAKSDTGLQRSRNEDSHLERAPLFVIADGMGGAQAGEVASQIAVQRFADVDPADGPETPAEQLAHWAEEANTEIYERAQSDADLGGMGTTLTAAFVDGERISLAHVGDSRAYRFRDGALERLTEDHSLVEELIRQGRLTAEEAEEHPQRSIITRALGPEPTVEVDRLTLEGADADIFLLCSDGLSAMVTDAQIADILKASRTLAKAGKALIDAANAAGGRDNITVILFRLAALPDKVPAAAAALSGRVHDEPTEPLPAGPPPDADESHGNDTAHPALSTAIAPRVPRARRSRQLAPRMPSAKATRTRASENRRRLARSLLALVIVLALLGTGALLAGQAVYFVSTDANGQVTIYNGFPYSLPGGIHLYTEYFVSGVTVAEISSLERRRLFNDELRSQVGASTLVRQLELDQIQGQ